MKFVMSVLLVCSLWVYQASAGDASKISQGVKNTVKASYDRRLARKMFEYGLKRGAADAEAGVAYTSGDLRGPLWLSAIQGRTPDDRRLVSQALSSRHQNAYLSAFGDGYKSAMRAHEKAPAVPTVTLVDADLTSLGFSVLDYTMDHSGRMPDMESAVKLESSLKGYIGASYLQSRLTAGLLSPNPRLSGVLLRDIPDPKTTICVFDPHAQQDGSVDVLFVDGTVRRIAGTTWEAIKKKNHITVTR